MKAFTQLYSELDQTTKTNDKVQSMVNYFTKTDAKDSIWAIALLTGRRPKRPIKTSDMKIWATELADIPFWLFEDSYAVVGDLAETISLLIPMQNNPSEKSLNEVMNEILLIQQETDEAKKEWLLSIGTILQRMNCLFLIN